MLQQQDRWIWPFELTEKIGEGGMGVVYKARYVVNDRTVAVKLLPSDVTDETLLSRFEREVEILKTLRHPNIVYCFGGACENKRRFYAMELVEGGTLDDMLKKRGRLPWELVAEFARQMCSALAYAHERGIIHRDIKPGNFLVTGEGKLKLSDFGLATLIAGRRITAAGRTAGTYEYMAPEQITGKELTPRTDLYALGCVLFELLTGRPPFLGGNSAEVLHSHLKKEPPRLSEVLPDAPHDLDRLLQSLLAKNPLDRPASAVDVGMALRDIAPMVLVSGGTANAGVSSRVVQERPKHEPREDFEPPPARQIQKRAPRKWPRIWPLVATAVIGGLATTFAGLVESRDNAEHAVDEWIEAFQGTDFPVRTHAAKVLGRLSARSPKAFKVLEAGLDDSNPQTRRLALIGLKDSGAAGARLMPRLVKMHHEEDQNMVRIELQTAMDKLKNPPGYTSTWSAFLIGTIFAVIIAAGWVWFRGPEAPPPRTE